MAGDGTNPHHQTAASLDKGSLASQFGPVQWGRASTTSFNPQPTALGHSTRGFQNPNEPLTAAGFTSPCAVRVSPLLLLLYPFSDWNRQRKLLYCHSPAQSDNPRPHCWEMGSAGLTETRRVFLQEPLPFFFLAVWVLLLLFPLDNRARRKNVTGSLVQPRCISSCDVSPGIAASAPHTRWCPEPQWSEESQTGTSGTWITLIPKRAGTGQPLCPTTALPLPRGLAATSPAASSVS